MKTDNFSAEYLRGFFSYNPETGVFRRLKKWGSQDIGSRPGCVSPQGYLQIGVKSRTYPAQRLAWLHYYGEWPAALVDHIDRNKQNNAIHNLRLVTRAQNSLNSGGAWSTNKTSGVRGVVFRGNRYKTSRTGKVWAAHIRVQGKTKHLGSFSTLEEAISARKAAEAQIWSPT